MKMNKLLILLGFLVLSGCTDSRGAIKAAENYGLKDVKITGYEFFACSEHDTYSTGFTAKTKEGKYVEGVVCAGVLKGSTVRTF